MPIFNFRYTHRVEYYETDAMRFAHHSHFIRWAEEARHRFFREAGFDWRLLEEQHGLMLPVLFQSIQHFKAFHFDDIVRIDCILTKFNGVKMNFRYAFFLDGDDALYALGMTKHGFLDRNYSPVALQRVAPSAFYVLQDAYNKQANR